MKASSKYETQREYMRKLFQKHGGDKDKVCAELAQAIRRGLVSHRSNLNRITEEYYAQALWYDGIKKGWLTDSE
jgi:hypothetical protein